VNCAAPGATKHRRQRQRLAGFGRPFTINNAICAARRHCSRWHRPCYICSN
jgi:hypothetical protein